MAAQVRLQASRYELARRRRVLYNVLYMGSTRTQIYLTAEQRAKIDAVCEKTGVSMAEVVRAALNEYLGAKTDEAYREILERTFGIYPDFEVPPRSEWDRGYG
ncbi:MAG: CopG family transcriptional regulator [Thermoleophilia bacterium]|nr:CopG family transcriptional regulator [Thermoleophilia bacterium]